MKTSELDRVFVQLGEFKCRFRAQAKRGYSVTCSCAPGNRACEYALKQKPVVTVHRLTATGAIIMGSKHYT